MPVNIEKKKDGKYQVSHGGVVSAKDTTKEKAEAQKRLLLAVSHGWKPTKTASERDVLIEKVSSLIKIALVTREDISTKDFKSRIKNALFRYNGGTKPKTKKMSETELKEYKLSPVDKKINKLHREMKNYVLPEKIPSTKYEKFLDDIKNKRVSDSPYPKIKHVKVEPSNNPTGAPLSKTKYPTPTYDPNVIRELRKKIEDKALRTPRTDELKNAKRTFVSNNPTGAPVNKTKFPTPTYDRHILSKIKKKVIENKKNMGKVIEAPTKVSPVKEVLKSEEAPKLAKKFFDFRRHVTGKDVLLASALGLAGGAGLAYAKHKKDKDK